MRASTETLLSLFEWAELMQLNPWEVAQFGEGFPQTNSAQCPFVFFQRSWPFNYLSREEVAATIEKAEEAIAQQLGFYPAPKYLYETVPVPALIPATMDWPFNTFGYTPAYPAMVNKGLTLSKKWVMGGGRRAYTAIEDVAVTYQDLDGDGVNERWTASVNTTVTDEDEIGVYYTSTDRLTDDLDETWRIRPVKVSISGGTATITGHAALMVVPAKELVTNPEPLNVSTAANFVTSVSIVRVYRDTTTTEANPAQGWALWDAVPGDCSDDPCVETAAPICVAERSMKYGIIAANYADPSCAGWRWPDRVQVNYLAGYPLVNGRMAREMADIVAHLAAAWLPVDECGCERSSRILHYWRAEPGDMGANNPPRAISAKEIDTPFGSLRGATYAWQRVKMLKMSGASRL